MKATQGTLEMWIFAAGYGTPSREYAIFDTTAGGAAFRIVQTPYDGAIRFAINGPAGGGTLKSDTVQPIGQWMHFAVEWKLDSENPADNWSAMWFDGVNVGQLTGLPEFGMMEFGVDDVMALGTLTGEANQWGWRGLMDNVRITDELMGSLYELDADGNFDVPTEPAIPEPATMSMLVLGVIAGIARRRR
jgi:hypothetical protein